MDFVFDNDRPIYIQLVEQMEKFIVSGELASGVRLPSVRDFAVRCRVNPNTMQRALAELEELGLIYTERTNGKFVTSDEDLIKKFREKYAENKAVNFLTEMEELGYTKEETLEYLKNLNQED